MRWQTSTGCEIQAPLTRRGFPTGGTKVPALKGRPTVKRRDAAAKPAFHGRNFVTAGISIRVVVLARPKMSNLQKTGKNACLYWKCPSPIGWLLLSRRFGF